MAYTYIETILLTLTILIEIASVTTTLTFLEAEKPEYNITKDENLILNCTVDSSDEVQLVTWKRDGLLMDKYKRLPKEKYTSNKMVMILSIADAEDSALYTCLVRTKSGTVLVKNFRVPPITVPSIVALPSHVITAKVDAAIRLKCGVSKSFTSSYKWLLNGKEITSKDLEDTRYKIKNYQFFKIRRVLVKDSGYYTCSVSNKVGTREVTYFLDVKGQANDTADQIPKLIKNNNNALHLDIVLNDISLNCRVTGAKPINMTWLKNDKPLGKRSGANGYQFSHDNQILKLAKVLPTDRGYYTCIAENRYGKMSHKMQVDAVEKKRAAPMFLDKEEKEYIGRKGENLTVQTRFLAFGNVHFQLLLDMIEYDAAENKTVTAFKILKTPRQYQLIKMTDAAAEYKLEFYFRNLSAADFQNYTVMAGNIIGYDVFKFYIKEEKVQPNVIALEVVGSDQKKFVDGPIFIVLVLCACFLVVATLATFLYCLRSKRGFNNNNRNLYSKNRLERVVLNLDNALSQKPEGRGSPRRMSSCQTEEYIASQNIPLDPEWEVSYENIEFVNLLGEGAFGRVMLGIVHELPRHTEPTTVAIKMLKNDATEKELKDLLSEINVMKSIGKHNNIINLLGVSSQSDELCMVAEYCRYGNLRDFLRERRPTLPPCLPQIEQLTMQNLISYCLQVAKGMDYLSSKKCIHRDIAARNVLVADDYVMKIADFGLARDIHGDEYYRKHTDGRLPVKWMALEALFDRVYTTQSDVWSYGILIWEIVTFGGSPYPGVPFEKLCDLLNDGYRMEKPVNCTEQLYRLMSDCWKRDPSSRPTFSAIVSELSQLLITISGVEYLQLQLIESQYPAESFSSSQNSPTNSRRVSSSVFEDNSDENDIDDIDINSHLVSEIVDGD